MKCTGVSHSSVLLIGAVAAGEACPTCQRRGPLSPQSKHGISMGLARTTKLFIITFGLITRIGYAQYPDYDRGMKSITCLPGTAPGLYQVKADWYIQAPESDQSDLSTEVVLKVNNSIISSQFQPLVLFGVICWPLPPCSGSTCGLFNEGNCIRSDLAILLGVNFCDCVIFKFLSFPDVSLVPGDFVTVDLIPVAGSLPETYTSDDSLTVSFTQPCPTVSEWGLLVMTLITLTAGTILIGRRKVAGA